MREIEITINKMAVYDEVAKTTSYEATKNAGEDIGLTYDRIFTKDDDRLLLERFFADAANYSTSDIRRYVISKNDVSFSGRVDLSKNFICKLKVENDFAEEPFLNSMFFSLFVNYILSEWYKISNADRATIYITDTGNCVKEIIKLLCYRSQPKRVIKQ